MKLSITYEELMPSTVAGYAIKISYIYSSFDQKEVDKLKSSLKDEIGTGIISEINKDFEVEQ